MRLASIDAGTNTIRILITGKASGENRTCSPLYRQKWITKLGSNLAKAQKFGYIEMKSSIDALSRCAEAMRRNKVERYFAAATQGFREAGNALEFIEEVRKRTGINLTVIEAETEARLTCEGIRGALGGAVVKNSVMVDIGGGSTEIMRSGSRMKTWVSIKLGTAHLTTLFSPHDPPHDEEISSMRFFVRERLYAVKSKRALKRAGRIIGTAGTYTTIAAIARKMSVYDPDKINGTSISRGGLQKLARKLFSLSGNERLAIRGMEKGREFLIVPGLVVAEEVMDVFSARETVVSDGSLLEGIIQALKKGKIKGEVYEETKI